MKKTLLSLFAFAALATEPAAAQRGWIPDGTTYEVLDANNISAPLRSDGLMFWDLKGTFGNIQNSKYFRVPKSSNTSTIFAGGLWIGGKDNNNTLYTVSDTYRQNGDGNYWFGPVAKTYDSAFNVQYDRFWKISAAEIEWHRRKFRTLGYAVPQNIADWPAHGNTARGEAANLAPFQDVNSNGIYDPANGDFPLIKGSHALYFINNESGGIKEPYTPAMELEIHGMVYAFDDPTNPDLYNTIFLNYRIVNRSNRDYHDVRFGMWTDFDIGYFDNDYVGSFPDLNAYYGYNGTELDTTMRPALSNYPTFGATPPAQGVMFLGGAEMSSFMYYNNDWTERGNPQTASDFYNYLNATWRDGQPLTFGGYGKNDVTNFSYRYYFPGSSDPNGKGFQGTGSAPFNWSEDNTDGNGASNTPADRRGVGAIGPFTLNSGESICFDVAYPFAQGNDRLHSVDLLKQRMQNITTFYNSNYASNSCNVQAVLGVDDELEQQLVQVYPNPAGDEVFLNFTDVLADGAQVKIQDVSGRTVLKQQLQNQPEPQRLDVTSLSAGMYFLTISAKNAQKTVKLVLSK